MSDINEFKSIAYFTFKEARITEVTPTKESIKVYHKGYQTYLHTNDMFYREISKLIVIS